jgi:hypothetical protein
LEIILNVMIKAEVTRKFADGRLEGWKIGRLEDWKIGRMEDWKD